MKLEHTVKVFLAALLFAIVPAFLDLLLHGIQGLAIDGKLYMDIGVGIAIAILVYLIDLGAQLPEMSANIRRDISDSVKRRSPDFFQDVPDFTEQLDGVGRQIIKIMKSAFEIENQDNEAAKHFLSEQLGAMTNIISDLNTGIFRIKLGSFNLKTLIAAGYCRVSYKAVSTMDIEKFWGTPTGVNVLHQNIIALRDKKISLIERIFIYDGDNMQPLIDEMQKHADGGIKVFYLDAAQVMNDLRRRDFGIVDDGAVVAEVRLELDGNVQDTTFYFSGKHFEAQAPKITEILRIWNELRMRVDLKTLDEVKAIAIAKRKTPMLLEGPLEKPLIPSNP